MAEHAVPAGLLLVLALDLGLAPDRLPVRHARRPGHDRRPELALEPLGDDRDVGLAEGDQELLAGRRALDPGARLLLEHPLEGGAHLVEVGLRLRLDRHRQGRLGERRSSGRTSGFSFAVEGVAGLGHGQLGDRPDLAGLELADRLLVLAVEQQELADPLVLAAVGVPGVTLPAERPGVDPEVGQPADVRVGGRLEHADEQRAGRIGLDPDLVARLRLAGRPSAARRPVTAGSG